MESFTIFIIASMALIITPGPDMIYVLTRGIADGKRSGAISAIGVTTGILIHTMAAALGLAVLLKTSTYAFWTLKVVGYFTSGVGSWLKQREEIASRIRIGSGAVLMLLGIRLILPQKQ